MELRAQRVSPKKIAIAGITIFVVALGVRFLSWHDTRFDVEKVQSGVASDYRRTSRLLRQEGFAAFFDRSASLADPNLLGHPPGYAIAMTAISGLFGESNAAIQFAQIVGDAIAAVLILLIASKLLPWACGIIAGFLIALSPQFAWNSVLLLPDTLSVLPLLLAIFCLIHAAKKPRLSAYVAAGVFVGLSCWLRANALLLAPLLAALMSPFVNRGLRLRYAAALLLGTVFTIAPLTLRNWYVFGHFIPVSLGAGQTMLEGISDYDRTHRFGIPETDVGVMKMEAAQYNRPDYYSTLFAPDGVARERARLARGLAIVRANPGWFLGVMIRRAGSMLRLERARLISPEPPVTHQFANASASQRVWIATAAQLVNQASNKSAGAEVSLSADGQTLNLISDNSKYGSQIKATPVALEANNDYFFRVPVKIEEGRIIVSVKGAESDVPSASAILETTETNSPVDQPERIVEIPFVSGCERLVSLELSNGAPKSGRSIVQLGSIELFVLGPSSFLWTRYPRLVVRSAQRLFITAVMLPLSLFGVFLLLREHRWHTLVFLLVVPSYYLCVQSTLHTEYRYVLAIHYFLFALVAVTLYKAGSIFRDLLRRRLLYH